MDSAVAGLLGAVIGACVAIVNSLISNRHQRQMERERSLLEVNAAMTGELRTHIAEATQAMLSVQHSMEWICWFGLKGPHAIDDRLVSEYHREIHEAFPKLLGSLARVASFDTEIYEKLTSLAEEIIAIDARIAEALVAYGEAPDRAAKILAEMHPDAVALDRSLPPRLAETMKSARDRMYSQ